MPKRSKDDLLEVARLVGNIRQATIGERDFSFTMPHSFVKGNGLKEPARSLLDKLDQAVKAAYQAGYAAAKKAQSGSGHVS